MAQRVAGTVPLERAMAELFQMGRIDTLAAAFPGFQNVVQTKSPESPGRSWQ
jgi:hypothetical protein